VDSHFERIGFAIPDRSIMFGTLMVSAGDYMNAEVEGHLMSRSGRFRLMCILVGIALLVLWLWVESI
jgi:hypothetical protein